MNRARLKSIVIVLILGAGIYAAFNLWQGETSVTSRKTTPRSAASDTTSDTSAGVHLHLLQPRDEALPTTVTNLFRRLEHPKPKPKVRPKIVKPVQRVVAPPTPKPVVAPPPVVTRPQANMTYLGQLVRPTGTVLFLKVQEDVFLVQQGDRFGPQNQFQLAKVQNGQAHIASLTDQYAPTILSLVERSGTVPGGPPPTVSQDDNFSGPGFELDSSLKPISPLPPPTAPAAAGDPLE